MININAFISELKGSEKPLRIVVEESLEGVISGFLLSKAFLKLGKRFVLSYEDRKNVKNVLKEGYDKFILAFNEFEGLDDNIVVIGGKGDVNPEGLGIKTNKLCGIVYCFCLNIADVKEYGYFVIVAGLGENVNGLDDYCLGILNQCVKDKKIIIARGLRMFNNCYKEIVNALRYSYDPCLRSVFGEENKSIDFVKKIGLERAYEEGRKLVELNDAENERLFGEVILDMIGVEEGNGLGEVYIGDEVDLLWMRNALNLCINKKKIGLVHGFLCGNKEDRKKVNRIIDNYSLEMIKALKMIFMARIKVNKKCLCMDFNGMVDEDVLEELVKIIKKRKIFDVEMLLAIEAFDDKIIAYGYCNGEFAGNLPESLHFDDGHIKGVLNDENELGKIGMQIEMQIERFINAA